jgi:hypothetical protein
MGMSLGVVLPMMERPSDGVAQRWLQILEMARRAEELGADTVWLGDEIVWRDPAWPTPVGWWDCLTMAGAVAASTTSVAVGSWVMSAIQHHPGQVVRAAETLDEISGGRFVLGFGAGHGGGATAFGLAPTTRSRVTWKPWRSSYRCSAASRASPTRVGSTGLLTRRSAPGAPARVAFRSCWVRIPPGR